MLPVKYHIINILIFWSIFQEFKFHESIKSTKFVEFKYLEKTNYTVVSCVLNYSSFPPAEFLHTGFF